MPKSGRSAGQKHNISHKSGCRRNPKSIGAARRGTSTFKTFVVFAILSRHGIRSDLLQSPVDRVGVGVGASLISQGQNSPQADEGTEQ